MLAREVLVKIIEKQTPARRVSPTGPRKARPDDGRKRNLPLYRR